MLHHIAEYSLDRRGELTTCPYRKEANFLCHFLGLELWEDLSSKFLFFVVELGLWAMTVQMCLNRQDTEDSLMGPILPAATQQSCEKAKCFFLCCKIKPEKQLVIACKVLILAGSMAAPKHYSELSTQLRGYTPFRNEQLWGQ